MYGRDSIASGTNFQNSVLVEIMLFNEFKKITFLALNLSLCVRVISRIRKRNYSKNSKFGVLHLYHK